MAIQQSILIGSLEPALGRKSTRNGGSVCKPAALSEHDNLYGSREVRVMRHSDGDRIFFQDAST
jgi:hypothetical protein